MKSFKKTFAVIIALVLIISLVACGTDDKDDSVDSGSVSANTENADIEIAFITKSMSDNFFVEAKEAAEARAEELGIKLTYLAPEGGHSDSAGQVQIMEDCIIKGVNAIIIDVCDDVSLNATIVKANNENIPVILFNDIVDAKDLDDQGGRVDCYVGLNSYEAAKMMAEYCLETSEPGKVAVLEGMTGTLASIERTQGFVENLSADFEVVTSQTANWDKNEGYNVAQNMLTANPDITVFWSCNSMMAMGAIQAIEDMGLTGIDVYDFDCEADDISAIKDGKLKATLRYPTTEWSRLAVDTTMSILSGEQVEAEVFTDVMVVTPENVDTIG